MTGIASVPDPLSYLTLSVPLIVVPDRLPENVPVEISISIPLLAMFVPLMMTGLVLLYDPESVAEGERVSENDLLYVDP